MDEKIIKIVSAKLRKFEGEPMNQEKLSEIRDAVYSGTKTNKFAPFSNVKKWVKAARAGMKKEAAAAQKKGASRPQKHQKPEKQSFKVNERRYGIEPVRHAPSELPRVREMPRHIEASLNSVKEESAPEPQLQEVALAKPTVVFDKVYLQSIKFEIAGIRQTMERVSRQLDKLEREIVSQKED